MTVPDAEAAPVPESCRRLSPVTADTALSARQTLFTVSREPESRQWPALAAAAAACRRYHLIKTLTSHHGPLFTSTAGDRRRGRASRGASRQVGAAPRAGPARLGPDGVAAARRSAASDLYAPTFVWERDGRLGAAPLVRRPTRLE